MVRAGRAWLPCPRPWTPRYSLLPSGSDTGVGLNRTIPAGAEAVALWLTLVSYRSCPAPGPPELASDCADKTVETERLVSAS